MYFASAVALFTESEVCMLCPSWAHINSTTYFAFMLRRCVTAEGKQVEPLCFQKEPKPDNKMHVLTAFDLLLAKKGKWRYVFRLQSIILGVWFS